MKRTQRTERVNHDTGNRAIGDNALCRALTMQILEIRRPG